MSRAAVVASLVLAAAAHADEPVPATLPAPAVTPAPEVTPWAHGVSPEQQARARAVFDEANQLFAEQAHAPALDKYRAALELWDHPLVRFNMAVTLIRLDRILEAADTLEKALAYGDKPFKAELYQSALDYQALLRGRVGHIEVTCDQQGANILLDGKPWFACPGTQQRRVMAGEHAVVGELAGHITSSRRLVVDGGKTLRERVRLVPLDTAVVLEYPYRRWLPWTITGAGAAIALGGVGFYLSGRSQMSDFEDNYARDCAGGCEKDLADHPALRSQRDGAKLKGTLGLTMMITGGAVTIGGVVFAIMNRPRRILPNVEVAPTAGGVTAAKTWQF